MADNIFYDVLKHRVTKLVHKVDIVWGVYKSIHEANQQYVKVQYAFQNEWSKWSTRVATLKEMMPHMQEDPEAPTNFPNLLKVIDLLNEIIAFHGKLGMQLQNKLKMFSDMEKSGMPRILDDNGLKDFATWKDELGGLLPHFKGAISLTY